MSQYKDQCAVCSRGIWTQGSVSVRSFNQTDGDILEVLNIPNKSNRPWSASDTEECLVRDAWIHTSQCRRTSRDVSMFPHLVEKMNRVLRGRGIDESRLWKVKVAKTVTLSAKSDIDDPVSPASNRRSSERQSAHAQAKAADGMVLMTPVVNASIIPSINVSFFSLSCFCLTSRIGRALGKRILYIPGCTTVVNSGTEYECVVRTLALL